MGVYHGFDICLHCRGELIERRQTVDREEYFMKYGEPCKKCGRPMRLVCTGEKGIDHTIIYTVLFSGRYNDTIEQIKAVAEIGNISIDQAKKRLSLERGTVLFEGDVSDTYNCMERLDDVGIVFDVNPEFPFGRYFICDICEDCGTELVDRIEDVEGSKEQLKQGKFCENCNSWAIWFISNKIDRDETIYKIIVRDEEYNDIQLETIANVVQTSIDDVRQNIKAGEIHLFEGQAPEIYHYAKKMADDNIVYMVYPEFPYEVLEDYVLTEEDIKEIARMNNWQFSEEKIKEIAGRHGLN